MDEEKSQKSREKDKSNSRSNIKFKRSAKKEMQEDMKMEKKTAGSKRDEHSKLRSSLGAMKPVESAPVTLPQAKPADIAKSPEPADSAKSTEPEQPKEPKPDKDKPQEKGELTGQLARDAVDYTKLPSLLDKEFEMYDEEGAVRATTITPSKSWTRKAQKALLAAPTTASLEKKEQKTEKIKAFDLLDAVSKSGGLTLQQAELHIVLVSTHCFDQTLLDTLIKDNVNPIEKVERSMLILASTIHGVEEVEELISPDQAERVKTYSPALFDAL